MGRVIVLTSGKGGVGKTSITAGVGVALSHLGRRVVLVDADIGLNNLDMLLGVENKIIYDLVDVIDGRCRLKQAIVDVRHNDFLSVLPSSNAFEYNISIDCFRNVISRLRDYYDYVLIDCPAGIDMGFYRAVIASDEAIIVTTPHTSAVRDADKVVSLLATYNKSILGVIANRMRADLVMRGDMMSVKQVKQLLRVPLIGIVPDNDDLVICSQMGNYGELYGEAMNSFRMIAKNIENDARYLYDYTAKYRGVKGKIKLLLKGGDDVYR